MVATDGTTPTAYYRVFHQNPAAPPSNAAVDSFAYPTTLSTVTATNISYNLAANTFTVNINNLKPTTPNMVAGTIVSVNVTSVSDTSKSSDIFTFIPTYEQISANALTTQVTLTPNG
jgi:hypothetical protein